MGFEFVERWKKELQDKENVGVQVDLIEEQYKLIIRDYAQLKKQFQELRFRKAQLQKQIENLKEKIGEYAHENTD